MKPISRFDDFPAYTPIEPYDVLSARLGIPADQIVKLDANENLYGPSPKAIQTLSSLDDTHIYPDPESRALRGALAGYTGLPVKNLLAGAGADELIDLILRVMIGEGEAVLSFPPTFGMYAFDARLNGAKLIEIPRRDDFSLDLAAVLKLAETFHPKVIFLTSPNNPDGRMITEDEFEAILSLPVLVVLDEAYIEFSDSGLGKSNSRIGEVLRRENLVVLRTFSKWAGLAGLRIGFGAFPEWMLPVLWKVKQPYNVNTAASHAAIASIADQDYLKANVARIITERQRLLTALQKIPFLTPFPSRANFILCKVTGLSAKALQGELMKQGILVRYYDTDLLHDYIRISVGRPQDTDQLVEALQNVSWEKGEYHENRFCSV
ncbi:MAG: histidinol-phosphate transaminase [Chloroflexi bacterium]|nr:histidinol-phosphate transaminase [Chloroflexota bacterium]